MKRAVEIISRPFLSREISSVTTPACAWFAVQVKRHLESTVAIHLRNNGFATVLPMCRTRKALSDRTKTVDLPLFPGYVFCEFDPSKRLQVEYVPGVNGIVSFGSKLAEVDRAEISAIQSVLLLESTLLLGLGLNQAVKWKSIEDLCVGSLALLLGTRTVIV